MRVYNRALTPAEIQTDMNTQRHARHDAARRSPTKTPAPGSAGVNVGHPSTATFSEAMRTTHDQRRRRSSSATRATRRSRDRHLRPDRRTWRRSRRRPRSSTAATYTATVKGGAGGVTDYVGQPARGRRRRWTFSTEASPPPILVVDSAANPFGALPRRDPAQRRAGRFTTLDVVVALAAVLGDFDVVVLGDMPLTPAQVTTLTDVGERRRQPDRDAPGQAARGLLGLTDAGSDARERVPQGRHDDSGPGAGIVGQTIQFHGTADRYTLNGATAVATLYSNAATATTNPAVTLRSVGSSGGQAAAFTYDLARSVVYTRQGNPAWAGQERDGVLGIRPDDMFFGAKAGDVQPDWVDTNKIAIPQADEQQRLLVEPDHDDGAATGSRCRASGTCRAARRRRS